MDKEGAMALTYKEDDSRSGKRAAIYRGVAEQVGWKIQWSSGTGQDLLWRNDERRAQNRALQEEGHYWRKWRFFTIKANEKQSNIEVFSELNSDEDASQAEDDFSESNYIGDVILHLEHHPSSSNAPFPFFTQFQANTDQNEQLVMEFVQGGPKMTEHGNKSLSAVCLHEADIHNDKNTVEYIHGGLKMIEHCQMNVSFVSMKLTFLTMKKWWSAWREGLKSYKTKNQLMLLQ